MLVQGANYANITHAGFIDAPLAFIELLLAILGIPVFAPTTRKVRARFNLRYRDGRQL